MEGEEIWRCSSAGFQSGGMDWAKERRKPLEAEKGKEMDQPPPTSPLSPHNKNS